VRPSDRVFRFSLTDLATVLLGGYEEFGKGTCVGTCPVQVRGRLRNTASLLVGVFFYIAWRSWHACLLLRRAAEPSYVLRACCCSQQHQHGTLQCFSAALCRMACHLAFHRFIVWLHHAAPVATGVPPKGTAQALLSTTPWTRFTTLQRRRS
jgi:hypothetical protein